MPNLCRLNQKILWLTGFFVVVVVACGGTRESGGSCQSRLCFQDGAEIKICCGGRNFQWLE